MKNVRAVYTEYFDILILFSNVTESTEHPFLAVVNHRFVISWPRDFVLYILPLGLVRLRTFRFSTWVCSVQTRAQVLTRVRGGCVVHRCQNKNLLGI